MGSKGKNFKLFLRGIFFNFSNVKYCTNLLGYQSWIISAKNWNIYANHYNINRTKRKNLWLRFFIQFRSIKKAMAHFVFFRKMHKSIITENSLVWHSGKIFLPSFCQKKFLLTNSLSYLDLFRILLQLNEIASAFIFIDDIFSG